MHIKINEAEFNSLENREIGHACFSPIIPMIRGKSLEVKQQIYHQLSPGQKALFMFFAYHNHAIHSLHEFFWWSSYYYAQPKAWSEIMNSLRYFNAHSMLKIMEEIDKFLNEAKFPKALEEFTPSQKEIESYSNLPIIQSLYPKFKDITQETLIKIGKNIRNNPNQFIDLEG